MILKILNYNIFSVILQYNYSNTLENFINKHNNIINYILAFISGVIMPFLTIFIKNVILDKNNKFNLMRDLSDRVNRIYSRLEIVQNNIDANRITVQMIHNGSHYYETKESIQRVSVFFELTDISTSFIGSHIKDIPCTMISKLITKLLDEDYFDYSIYDNEFHNLYYASLTKETKRIYFFSLKDINDHLLGFMTVEFIDENKELNEEQIDDIRRAVHYMIDDILFVKSKNTKNGKTWQN